MIRAGLLAAWCAVLAVHYHRTPWLREVWTGPAWTPPAFQLLTAAGALRIAGWSALTAALAAVAAGIGRKILSALAVPVRPGTEAFAFSLGAGWGALSLAMAVTGLLGLWRAPLLLALLAAACWPAVLGWRELLPRAFEGVDFSRTHVLLIDAALLLAAASFLGALAPETFYDGLVYHLALPDLYLMRGGMTPVPTNIYAAMPQGGEMIYALALLLGPSQLAHMLNWSIGVACAAGVYALTSRLFGSAKAAACAALLFYAVPAVTALSANASVDLHWTLFQLLAVYAVAARFDDPQASPGWTTAAGVFAGLAMGVKYAAWPLAGVLFLALASRLPAERRTAELGRFAAALLLTLAVWPLRNLWFYGNPLQPFFAPGSAWRRLLADASARDLKATFGSAAGLLSYLRHPWDVLYGVRANTEELGLLPLAALPMIAFWPFRSVGAGTVRLCALLLWLAWSLSSTMARFFLPQTPLLAALAAGALLNMPRAARRVAAGALLAGAVSSLMIGLTWFYRYNADGVIFGREPDADYLARVTTGYPRPAYAAVHFANASLAPEAKVLLVGDARGFYLKRDYLASTIFDENPLITWLRSSRTPDEVAARFAAAGVTHMLLNKAEYSALIANAHSELALTEADWALYRAFADKHLLRLFEHKDGAPGQGPWCLLFEVRR